MATLVSERLDAPWRRRLTLPTYQIGEAAAYAGISAQTVAQWHKIETKLLKGREARSALSYYQLIEVAVVAAFRKAGVPLKNIRAAREYAQHILKSEHPFAQYQFKENAKHLFLDAQQVDVKPGTIVQADQGGQLGWSAIIGRLKEFEYEDDVALRWRVAGEGSPIVIDPRISFGAPALHGTPTWIIRGRFEAGESNSDIAEDFGLKAEEVKQALKFEVSIASGRGKSSVH
jgi:uncharacterized protein (DUF433 family)/DNA-binding transcriptional MerR regulator